MRTILSALPVLYPERTAWQRIDDWIGRASDAGERFGIMDLLIAAIAAEQRVAVWSRDHWDERMGSIPEGPDAALRQAARDLKL